MVRNSIHWVYNFFFLSKGFAVVSGCIIHITVSFILFTFKGNCKSPFWGSYQVDVISFSCNWNETTAKLYRTTSLNTSSNPQQRKHVAGTGNFAVIERGAIWLMLALFSFEGPEKRSFLYRDLFSLVTGTAFREVGTTKLICLIRNIYYQQVWIWSGFNSILGRGKKFK